MSSTAVSKTITELKVSAHLMTLDAGLFCIFNSPGAAAADAATGLPGVRLTAAPAPAGFDGEVGISGFNNNGWLGGEDGAALVRVVGGPAQVLVTVYQDPEAQHDAPKLQVIRLTEDAAEAPAQATPRVTAAASKQATPANGAADAGQGRAIEVAAHIYGRGDVGGLLGQWMGERGSKRWIEGFGLAPGEAIAAADLEYQAVLGRDWLSPWSEGGQFCGSRGMSLPILGMRVRLRGAAAKTHTLSVLAVFVDGTEIGPVSDGEACEAPSLSPLEAFLVTLDPLVKPTGSTLAAEKAVRQEAASSAVAPMTPAAPKPSRKTAPVATAEPPRILSGSVAKKTPTAARRR